MTVFSRQSYKIFCIYAKKAVSLRDFFQKKDPKGFFIAMKTNRFAHKIAKDLIQWMPVIGFGGEVIIVDEMSKMAEAIHYLRAQKVLGVDTESRPSFKRGVHYPTALVQIATEERCYLFRLSHIGLPQELANIFADASICKVGLAFKDDINGLRRLRNFKPANCVDLQSIAGQWGILDLSLQKMYAICFGRKISKTQQLTNWENTQLTAEQARYASTDAWATLRIYKELMDTEPLPADKVAALKQAEIEKQIQHQQEVLAAREAQMNKDTE